jgi:hypothetical protein
MIKPNWDNGAPDYKAEFERRYKINQRAKTDLHFRHILMEHYKHNCADWINDNAVTFDPRVKKPLPRIMPFVLFKRQEEFLQFLQGCLEDKENGLVEKARDIGASWLCVAFATWLWLFHEGTAIGFGSRKEEYVDKKGDPKALFPKIRQILQHLPKWQLPHGFKMDQHATYMKIINPANQSVISGEAGDNIGRGGRTTLFFKDESAHYERPELIEAALGDNTDVQIDISSVNGTNNVFYQRRMAGEVWTPDSDPEEGVTRVFVFEWSDHPLKTPEWYEKRRKRAEAEGLLHLFKQEVDRDYAGSIDRIIIPQEWVKAAIDAHIKLNFPIEGQVVAGVDIADEGQDKNALAIRHGVVLVHCQNIAGDGGDAATHFIPECKERKVTSLQYDSIGVGAAFKVAVKNMQDNGVDIPFRITPWNAGFSGDGLIDPDDHIVRDDPETPINKEYYANLKAQGWFRLRTRFYKTFRAVTMGEVYPYDDLISLSSEIPKLHQLVLELSQAQHKPSQTGKIMVDKKPDGARSPNMADGVVEAYSPVEIVSILDVL